MVERTEETIRKELITDIEALYPPDTHEEGRELLHLSLCHCWRSLPMDVLNSLRTLCFQKEHMKYTKGS